MPQPQDHDRTEQGDEMSDKDTLERIEHKVDALAAQLAVLINALAQDDEDEAPSTDMAGNPIPRRDEAQTTF